MSTYVWTEKEGLWESSMNFTEPPIGSMYYNPHGRHYYWTAHQSDIPGKEDRIAWHRSSEKEIQQMKTYLLIAGIEVMP